jgi:GTPase SAR1 family protein
MDFNVDGCDYEIALWDTAGQQDHERMRPYSYPGTDIMLLQFIIDSPDSLEEVQDKGSVNITMSVCM